MRKILTGIAFGVVAAVGVAVAAQPSNWGNWGMNSSALPLTGGTLTGDLTGPGIYECTGACPAWTYSPKLAAEDAVEFRSMCYASGGVTLGADLQCSDYDLIAPDVIYQPAETSDVAADALDIHGADAYAQSTVNTAGGSVNLCPGIGRRFVTVTDKANSAGDTLTFTVNGSATVLTAGTSWVCAAAANNAACALNLKNAATMPAGITASCADGTCSTAVVYFTPAASTVCTFPTPVIADAGGGGAFGTATGGVDGQILFQPDSSYATPVIAAAGDTDTGISLSPLANAVYVVANTTAVIQAFSNGVLLGGYLNMGANLLYSSSSILNLGTALTSSHGLGTGAVGSGGASEWDGASHFDGAATFYSTTTTIGGGVAGTDYILKFDGETNDCSLTHMEDEDYITAGCGVTMLHGGSNTNSESITLQANNAGTVDNATIQAIYGADPYLRISAPNDSGTATATMDLHDTVVVIGTGTADIDYALQFNGETNDGAITWMEDEVAFDTGAASFACTAADLGDGNMTNVGTIAADSINADGTTVDYNDVNIIELAQEDVGATCTLGQIRIDTGGATTELCLCTATNTWKCAALAAGPAD